MNAILPAAGRGTRMSSVTSGASKEMLPVGQKSVLGWAIEEARLAGVTSISVVSSPEKPDLNQYLAIQEPDIEVHMQFVADGLAPAIALAARPEPTIVILPDTLFHPAMPSRRIARALSEGFDIVVLTETVSDSEVHHYGIVEGDSNGAISKILEKPDPSATTSRQAVAARYGLSARMMGFLLEAIQSLKDETNEIPLTPILNLAIMNGYEAVSLARLPAEHRYDCGNVEGYRAASEVFV